MADTRRIPFVLNLEDPVDCAIWQALEPLLQRHRASAFIRGAVAEKLGIGEAGSVVPLALPASTEPPRAKRPAPQLPALVEQIEEDEPDDSIIDVAADNFLSMFG